MDGGAQGYAATTLPGVMHPSVSFAQLKSAYTHENIIRDLGKLGADDPH